MITIELTQGKAALIDDEDFERVSKYKWTLSDVSRKKFYARRSDWNKGNQKTILMHRFIMNAPEGFEVDHIDGDGLNNQKHNLRLATSAENRWNSQKQLNNKTGFWGVGFDRRKKDRCFYARIKVNNKCIFLGHYRSATEAAMIYDAAAKKFHGEFARLNFP